MFVVLALGAIGASILLAYRAVRVDPMVMLRHD
jgi:ABC-type lipoprotein release transport system permease subunit